VARGVLGLGDMKPEKPTEREANQGEGNRFAARNYNDQLREFVASGKVEPAARAAESYVEHRPEAAARAERKARPASIAPATDPLQATRSDRDWDHIDEGVQSHWRALGNFRPRRGPHTHITLDEMLDKSRTVVERVRPILNRAVGKLRSRFARK